MSAAHNVAALNVTLAESSSMLNDAQRMIDDGLELAALVVAIADGRLHPTIDPQRVEFVARGIISSRSLVALATYLTDPAINDGKATRAGLLRSISGYYDYD